MGEKRTSVLENGLIWFGAGISSESVSARISGKWFAVGAAVLGMAGAVLFPVDDITDFLYLIGSVFAPMIAIQIADFFLLRKNHEDRTVDWMNMAVWAVGFVLYRVLMNVDMIVGNTLPNMAITIVLCLAVSKLRRKAPA